MADKSEMHPVVQFLLARMETHPDEFHVDGRWNEWIYKIRPLLTTEERIALRGPDMDHIHSEIMDELMNGEDRRRKEAEKAATMQSLYANQVGTSASGLYPNSLTQANSIQLGNERLDESTLAKIKKKLGL